jgi:hypothetical protein
VAALGREIVTINAKLPSEAGDCTFVAEIADENGKPVRSLRDVRLQ